MFDRLAGLVEKLFEFERNAFKLRKEPEVDVGGKSGEKVVRVRRAVDGGGRFIVDGVALMDWTGVERRLAFIESLLTAIRSGCSKRLSRAKLCPVQGETDGSPLDSDVSTVLGGWGLGIGG